MFWLRAIKYIIFSESIIFGAFEKLCIIEIVDVWCIYALSELELLDDALLLIGA
jgi:hypothetical protein